MVWFKLNNCQKVTQKKLSEIISPETNITPIKLLNQLFAFCLHRAFHRLFLPLIG